MDSKHKVFQGRLGVDIFGNQKLNPSEEREILSEMFEQLLLFDEIVLRTNRLNSALTFLIKHLGINLVEELIERKLIRFLLWSPALFTGAGRQLEGGGIDKSVIIGQPPIAAGSLSDQDIDPNENIKRGIDPFGFHRDRRRSFTRKAIRNYIVPIGSEFSSESARIVIDAYKENNLRSVGLPYTVEPDQMSMVQRQKLLNLGSTILESALLSVYDLKGFNNYDHIKLFQTHIDNIGKAYQVTDNTTEVLKHENIPDFKSLYLNGSLNFETAIRLRNSSNGKYFRKWINEESENEDSEEIITEYLKEIKGDNKYFQSFEGKFIKVFSVFGISTAISLALSPAAGIPAGFGLSLLDTFWLDNILKGKNPSMFLEDIKMKMDD